METYKLINGIDMPKLILGVPLICATAHITEKQFVEALINAFSVGLRGFDTSHDYGQSEPLLGKWLPKIRVKFELKREQYFINTKIGNGQQKEGYIERYVDDALKRLKCDYLDAMLLHWPVPDVFVKNWEKLVRVYETGKVKAIGIANAKVRHLEQIRNAGLTAPHILQTEIHPLNTCLEVRKYCIINKIQLQACTPLCAMLPIIRNNETLNIIARSYNVSLGQLILRWHLQNGIAPVFRSFNKEHLRQMSDVFSFSLSEEDMNRISTENINYRYHPESINCPGF